MSETVLSSTLGSPVSSASQCHRVNAIDQHHSDAGSSTSQQHHPKDNPRGGKPVEDSIELSEDAQQAGQQLDRETLSNNEKDMAPPPPETQHFHGLA